MSKVKKSRKETNPEILYEREQQRTKNFYDDDMGEMRLFPDALVGSSVSATESTGLIQVAPITPALQKVYDDVYSYRQPKPLQPDFEE
ncbi:MAG: hypothetical protein IJ365_00175 [Clostridia bacterium]|nr:hypothetical protein [Clostridia bacterium]